jgi:hypothetical protein
MGIKIKPAKRHVLLNHGHAVHSTRANMALGGAKKHIVDDFLLKKHIVEILLVACLDQSESVSVHGHF